MTRSIADTPIRERTLLIEGRLSLAAIAASRAGLPGSLAPNELALFVSHNYAEVPVGFEFDGCYRASDESQVIWVKARVVAVTQQFAVALDEIPHGWKTIVVIGFDPEVPRLVADLPTADGWDLPISVLISSRETWEARQSGED